MEALNQLIITILIKFANFLRIFFRISIKSEMAYNDFVDFEPTRNQPEENAHL